jgi:hypothetical protein
LVLVAFPLYVYYMYKNYQHISNSFLFIVIVLVWFVIPTTLISLNLSRDILRNTYELNQSMTKDLEFIRESNDVTITGMKDNATAIRLAKHADELMSFIESLEKEVKTNKMKENSKSDSLADMMNEFEKVSLSISSDVKYISIIRQTLANPLITMDPIHEDPAIILHNLIILQLNVGLAQQTAYRQLQQAGKETLNSSNQ